MKQSEITNGGRYETKIAGAWVEVEVVRAEERLVCAWRNDGAVTRFRVRRVDNGRVLPKARSAAALHPRRASQATAAIVARWEAAAQRADRSNLSVLAWKLYHIAASIRAEAT